MKRTFTIIATALITFVTLGISSNAVAGHGRVVGGRHVVRHRVHSHGHHHAHHYHYTGCGHTHVYVPSYYYPSNVYYAPTYPSWGVHYNSGGNFGVHYNW